MNIVYTVMGRTHTNVIVASFPSTSMGRPQLYHSKEEKALANRAKSKRHYDKYVLHEVYVSTQLTILCLRSKESINKQRRRIYKRLHRR
jgi:hypothetical protein